MSIAAPIGDFGRALYALHHRYRVGRRGWNGKGMWLALIPKGVMRPFILAPQPPVRAFSVEDVQLAPANFDTVELETFIIMRTADGKFVPWLASQSDVLAEDWEIVE